MLKDIKNSKKLIRDMSVNVQEVSLICTIGFLTSKKEIILCCFKSHTKLEFSSSSFFLEPYPNENRTPFFNLLTKNKQLLENGQVEDHHFSHHPILNLFPTHHFVTYLLLIKINNNKKKTIYNQWIILPNVFVNLSLLLQLHTYNPFSIKTHSLIPTKFIIFHKI